MSRRSLNYAKAVIETVRSPMKIEVVSITVETAIVRWRIPYQGISIVSRVLETLLLLPYRLAYAEYHTKRGFVESGTYAISQVRTLLDQQWDSLKAVEAEASRTDFDLGQREVSTIRFGPAYSEESIRSLEQLTKKGIYNSISHVVLSLADIESLLRGSSRRDDLISLKIRLLLLYCESFSVAGWVVTSFVKPTTEYIVQQATLSVDKFRQDKQDCEEQLIRMSSSFTTSYAAAQRELSR